LGTAIPTTSFWTNDKEGKNFQPPKLANRTATFLILTPQAVESKTRIKDWFLTENVLIERHLVRKRLKNNKATKVFA
jgi:hypothetical protein